MDNIKVIQGIHLDDHHIAAPATDHDGSATWCLLTFKYKLPAPDKNGKFKFTIPPSRIGNKTMWSLEIIEHPYRFEWSGITYILPYGVSFHTRRHANDFAG